MITRTVLEQRKESLQQTLIASAATHQDLKDRNKVIKKEIANIQGAIIEIDRLLDEL